MYIYDYNLDQILGLDPDESRVIKELFEDTIEKIYTGASHQYLDQLKGASDDIQASINVGTIGVIEALSFMATARDMYRAGKEYGRS